MSEWRNCRNILAIRLDNLGDVIMTNAALLELKHHYPKCKLTLLTSSMAELIVPYLESVDDCIIFDTPWVKLDGDVQQARVFQLIETLKSKQFDGCIIFNVYSQTSLPTALLTFLAGIPLRAAYARENPYQLLTHWCPDPEPLQKIYHQITRDLLLLKELDIDPNLQRIPRLKNVTNTAIHESKIIQEADIQSPFIIVNVDVSEEKRRLDIDLTKALILTLLDRGERILFTGQKPSPYLSSCIEGIKHPQFKNLIGLTLFKELLFLIDHAQAVISVNTSIMHIACAYDRPVLALYAKTNPQHTPWSERSDCLMYDVPAHLKSKNQIIQYVDQTWAKEEHDVLTVEQILAHFSQLQRVNMQHSSI